MFWGLTLQYVTILVMALVLTLTLASAEPGQNCFEQYQAQDASRHKTPLMFDYSTQIVTSKPVYMHKPFWKPTVIDTHKEKPYDPWKRDRHQTQNAFYPYDQERSSRPLVWIKTGRIVPRPFDYYEQKVVKHSCKSC